MKKTKPELWKQIEFLEQKVYLLERFLAEKGLLSDAMEYVEKIVQELEELPFD